MVDTSDIRRRVEVLEGHTCAIQRILRSVVDRLWPRKVNAKSRQLTMAECSEFQAEMNERAKREARRNTLKRRDSDWTPDPKSPGNAQRP